jgi:hypothetical protein
VRFLFFPRDRSRQGTQIHARQNRRSIASPTNPPDVLFVIGTSTLLCGEYFPEVHDLSLHFGRS